MARPVSEFNLRGIPALPVPEFSFHKDLPPGDNPPLVYRKNFPAHPAK
jgi:hypothetical protein